MEWTVNDLRFESMFRKSVILSLVLLLAGTALLGWVFTEQKKDKHLLEEQREKLKTNLSKLDEMVGDEIDVRHFGNIAYDENHQQETDKYKRQEEIRGLVLVASGVFALTGGAILSWWLLLGTARLLIRVSRRLTKLSVDFLRSQTKTRHKQPTEADAKESENEQTSDGHQGRVEKHSETLINSGWQNFNKTCANRQEGALPETGSSKKSKAGTKKQDCEQGKEHLGNQKLAVLLSDKESVEPQEPLKVKTEGPKSKSSSAGSHKKSLRLEESFKAQSDDLEKRMAEFKQMAQGVQQAALAHAKPVEQSINELTQQVSAFREYAAHQQERVKKLQEGYDWNIIRNFCLRIIRCIDNLDNRINRLSGQDIDTTDLEEIRDELVFALESTGVEPFEPEINGDYRGQEKNTEAVKEKEDCDDPKLTGKIAKVIRRGYQYLIDEENVKIVRPAQVRLFG
jgi:molecular chaperone GrpE (heat shock protein)